MFSKLFEALSDNPVRFARMEDAREEGRSPWPDPDIHYRDPARLRAAG